MTRISYMASLALSAAILASSALPAHAATETVLWSFEHAGVGYPIGRLHFMNGYLFGTGYGDPAVGSGQVFELTKSGGSWTAKTVWGFDGTNGAQPSAGLISNSSSVLFGTTSAGVTHGGGDVFDLYKSGGTWFSAPLWAFPGKSGDGANPTCDLIMDSSGNLYGTTQTGGAHGYGTVFELSSGDTETVLHSFDGYDGIVPVAGVLMDSSGNLYGTTFYGGNSTLCGGNGCGTVFELTQSGGVWTESVLHKFGNGSDGIYPQGVLFRDSKGALYGTTLEGGASGGYGTVFKVYKSSGVWKEKVLHAFAGGSDGANPVGGLRASGTSAYYGTAEYGGANKKGVVFKLTYSGGVWNKTTLHSFGAGSDGALPYDQVILDKSGNIYGTTYSGGAYGYGTVWEVVP
jgi:uncharacterized repeat protein (TIGR03803 family)